MDVKIKDRKSEVEYLRMGLAMAQFGVSYKHADLILKVQEVIKKKGGKYSLKDGSEIMASLSKEWADYDEANKLTGVEQTED